MSRIPRPAVLLAALSIAATGLAVSAATAAQAAPSCFPVYDVEAWPTNIQGYGELVCYDPTQGGQAYVKLQKNVGGVWTTVDEGMGGTVYYCNGTASTAYRAGYGYRWQSLTANCG
ncbi:hypothetical protein [Longispora albida]|uniref:hypothetical protein n=1 Tax=Longispora albida TaxID=203523 RepID=UPI000376EDB7|nr:hypothetical protein [Longispora albida]